MGTGSVETLGSGGFRARVYAGKDPITGKQVYLRGEVRRHVDQAERDRVELLAQVEAEANPDRSATVSTLMKRWLEVADLGLTTRDNTERYIRRVIEPKLGDMPLRKLERRVDILDRLYKHLQRCSVACDGTPFVEHKRLGAHDCSSAKCARHVCRPMKPSSVRRVHGILSPALAYAVSWNWIDRNPAAAAHPPKLNRRRARPPEDEQVARLLNLAFATSPELAMFLWLATTTGARRGELAGLRWFSVNFRTAVLRVEDNYVQRDGQSQLKETKTDQDRRLSLDPLTLQMLTDYREQMNLRLEPARLSLPADAFVFSPDPMGSKPWHPDHFSHAYRELADLVGIVEPLKNLRHFNATQLLSAGVDLATTAGRLGHSDGGATTLKVYADWMPATDRRAAEHLAADLTRLRDAQATASGGQVSNAPPLRRVARPLDEVLDPAVDGRATYLVVAAGLRKAITAGRLEAGDLVPTVDQLATWFGVARSTAQRAFSLLGEEGAIGRSGPRWIVAPALR